MNKWILVLCIGLILCLSIVPGVMAYDYSGNFDVVGGVTSTTYTIAGAGADTEIVNDMWVNDISTVIALKSISLYAPRVAFTWLYSVNSWSEDVEAYIGAVKIGEGVFTFNNNSATGQIQIIFIPTSWDVSGFSGPQWINFVGGGYFTAHGLADLTTLNIAYGAVDAAHPVGFAASSKPGNQIFQADYILNQQQVFHNIWSLTKVGTAVNIVVDKNIAGIGYPSRVYWYRSNELLSGSEPKVSTDDFDLYTSQVPIKLAVKDSYGNFHNTSLYYSAVVSLYALPTEPVMLENVTLTSGVTMGSIDDLDFMTFTCKQGDFEMFCTARNNNTAFSKVGGIWYQTNQLTHQFDVSYYNLPTEVVIKLDTPGLTTIKGQYHFASGGTYETTTDVTVQPSDTTSRVSFWAVDYTNGGMVSNATICYYDYGTGRWSNASGTNGLRVVSINTSTLIEWTARSYGYSANIERDFIMGDRTINIYMYRSLAPGAGNNTLWVRVRDDLNELVQGATVHLDDGQTKTTPNTGVVMFTVLDNSDYGISISKSGYRPASSVFRISGTQNAVSIILSRLTVTTAPTLAPGATATPAPAATIDVRTNPQKGDSMVKLLYDNGESIVMLCIVVTILGLLGVKLGE